MAAAGLGRRTWLIAGVLAVAALAYTFAVEAPRHRGRSAIAGDAYYIYLAGRSLAFDGDIDLSNQLRGFGDRWKLGQDPAQDGWRLPVRELGPSLLMVPGLRVHRALDVHPFWDPCFAAALAAMSIGLTFAGCAASVQALQRRGLVALSAGRRDLVALAATLGFVVPYYALVSTGYAHAPDAAAVAWLTAFALRGAGPLAVGLGLAAALLMRLQNALWLLLPAAWWVVEHRRAGTSPSRYRDAVAVLAVSVLGVLPQLYMNVAHPGSQRGAIRWDLDFFDLQHLGRDLGLVLFGGHGLLSWTPIAAVALVGLVLGLTRPASRGVALGALAVIGALTLLFACARDPGGGSAFGARRHAGCTVFVAIGLAMLSDWLARRTAGTRAQRLVAVGFAALLLGLVAYNLGLVEAAARGLVKLDR
ncbi:hypothetical protein [Nannocystis radixulma]|uniref:DUF2142 domain-containing protein n=1 Tax=Nannocystis radixulma TaxID=2995305 RepID=A0ABT5B2H6_9BACT|nr:hypothetical protein [Nannocystis radixulma]MDC0667342.1 hypothetical protein [Nannocystis radixulma]